jgi:hypothetical protein
MWLFPGTPTAPKFSYADRSPLKTFVSSACLSSTLQAALISMLATATSAHCRYLLLDRRTLQSSKQLLQWVRTLTSDLLFASKCPICHCMTTMARVQTLMCSIDDLLTRSLLHFFPPAATLAAALHDGTALCFGQAPLGYAPSAFTLHVTPPTIEPFLPLTLQANVSLRCRVTSAPVSASALLAYNSGNV